MNYLLIGSGAREHAIARTLHRSFQPGDVLYCFGNSVNPGILALAECYQTGDVSNIEKILWFCQHTKFEFAIIGPEAPLAQGVADKLWQHGIPVVGPKQALAQLETSKTFTRNLFQKYNIPASAHYKSFDSLNGVEAFLKILGDAYVIKADGLMGGKGVKVAGDHLENHDQALEYCQYLLDNKSTFLIEEKLIGQEFSLISFCDGEHLAHMPAVQDHKRAFENDTGPNTGGMGTYSDANHRLPFLTADDILAAQRLNEQVAHAVKSECGDAYQGILYGGFMATKTGVNVIEYNARFGDPEAINLLTLLESDFIAICKAIITGTLNQDMVKFSSLASVCKYLVPEGYPDHAIKGQEIFVNAKADQSKLLYGAVHLDDGKLIETGSRTIAVIATAKTISEAEQLVEAEIQHIRGPLFHRRDIGTPAIIDKRIQAMRELRDA